MNYHSAYIQFVVQSSENKPSRLQVLLGNYSISEFERQNGLLVIRIYNLWSRRDSAR